MAEYYYGHAGDAAGTLQGCDVPSNDLLPDQAAYATSGCVAPAVDNTDDAFTTAVAAEFNPRAHDTSDADAGRRYNYRYLHLPRGDHDLQNNGDTSSVCVAPAWWATPNDAAPYAGAPGASYGACGFSQRPCPELATHICPGESVAEVDRFTGDPTMGNVIGNSNPYLTAEGMSSSSTSAWCQQREQSCQYNVAAHTHRQQPSSRLQTSSASHYTHTLQGQRDVFHPVFPHHYPVAPPGASYPANTIPNFSQFRPEAISPLRAAHPSFYGDDQKSFGSEQECWAGTHPGRFSIGKSQSVRALYEENAALRRALQSIRKSSAVFGTNLPDRQMERCQFGELDPRIANDVAEGRAVSLRERGRWALQAAGDGNRAAWAGTPGRRHFEEGAPTHDIDPQVAIGAASHHDRLPPYHNSSQYFCDHDYEMGIRGYGGGFSGGRWLESGAAYWPNAGQDENARAGAIQGDGERGAGDHQTGTSLKQLLGGGRQKWSRQPDGKDEHRREEIKVRRLGAGENGGGGRELPCCAMCGGRLQRKMAEGGRKAGSGTGLPLRLCPACHPRAAGALPHSGMKSPPPLATQRQRNNVARAVLMACRPTPGSREQGANGQLHSLMHTGSAAANKPAAGGGRSSRMNILHLCRHFVGLSTSKATSPPSDA